MKTYTEERNRWFDDFRLRFEGHLSDELTGILDGRKSSDVWLQERRRADSNTMTADLQDVFTAYKALRITHQLQ